MNSTIFARLLIVLTIAGLCNSCGHSDEVMSSSFIQKRKYNNGFYVKNNKLKKDRLRTESSSVVNYSVEKPKTLLPERGHFYAGEKEGAILIHSIKQERNYRSDFKSPTDGCAEIILRNGDIISAVVEEVGVTEISYRKCENLTGPIYKILKSEVFLIKYENGSKDVFKEEEKEEKSVPASAENSLNEEEGKKVSVDEKEIEEESTGVISILSLVFGGLAFLVWALASTGSGIALGLVGMVLGIVGLAQGKKGKGMALAGFLIGLGIIMLTILFFLLIFLTARSAIDTYLIIRS